MNRQLKMTLTSMEVSIVFVLGIILNENSYWIRAFVSSEELLRSRWGCYPPGPISWYIENTSWKVLAYGIYARVVDVSEIERVRFLIQKQRVLKYRTKHFPCGILFIIHIMRHSSFWRPFYFKSFKNAKICRYTLTHTHTHTHTHTYTHTHTHTFVPQNDSENEVKAF